MFLSKPDFSKKISMHIMMTGGGTLGPVTPLLAVVEAWRAMDPSAEFVWVGTTTGPERTMVEHQGISFIGIVAPKLDRHAPLRWLFIPFKLLWSLKVASTILSEQKPDVVVTAGGYVSLPIVWMAKLKGIPVWVHQQDVRPGLANKLMAPAAVGVSVAWAKTLHAFPEGKSMQIGNPVRASVLNGYAPRAAANYCFDLQKPTVLVLGGGTGSAWLNSTVARIAPELAQSANVLHVTGRGKSPHTLKEGLGVFGYAVTELITQGMNDVLTLADLVVCRAGMGTISELSALHKSAIIIPIPASHQEDNTSALAELDAAVVLDQRQTTPQILLEEITKWLATPDERRKMGARLHAALPTLGVAEKLAHHLQSIAKNQKS